jgi:hypothetical protein
MTARMTFAAAVDVRDESLRAATHSVASSPGRLAMKMHVRHVVLDFPDISCRIAAAT